MAKDVDLSSHSWRELVFEGKNKEFGAYQMRKNSTNRHNLAMIIVGAALAVILTIVILIFSGVLGGKEEVDPNAGIDQAMVNLANEEEAPEEEQEQVVEEPEPEPEPEPEVEEVAQQKVTELSIEEDKNVKAESQITEINKEDDASFTQKNVESENTDVRTNVMQDVATAPQPIVNKETEKTPEPTPPAPPAPAPDPDENKVFTTVEQKATYPGGEAALMQWVNSNIQYPAMAIEEGAQGRVVVSFVVEKDGSITDVQVARGRHPELDKEAVRVVKKIPKKFVPAKQNGKNVRYKFNLPVQFKLQQ